MHPTAIVCKPWGKAEHPSFGSVATGLVQAAGRDVEPGTYQALIHRNLPAEKIHWIPALFSRTVIPGDPPGTPILSAEQAHLKSRCLRPGTCFSGLIPNAHLPQDTLPTFEGTAPIASPHRVPLSLAAVPKGLAFAIFTHHLESCLTPPMLAVPKKPWSFHVYAHGVAQVFRF